MQPSDAVVTLNGGSRPVRVPAALAAPGPSHCRRTLVNPLKAASARFGIAEQRQVTGL